MFEFVVRASCPLYISREQDAPTTAIFEKVGCSRYNFNLSLKLAGAR